MVCLNFDKNNLVVFENREKLPITEYILKSAYFKLKSPITLLGISPISPIIVESALLAAKELNAPILFIASLNQVDIDGGYTGWTPKTFILFLEEKSKELNIKNIPIIVGLDHGGPWLKDEHIIKNYDYESAIEATYKSIEAAIRAGYDLIHIDTTVDPYNPYLDPSIVAKRTIELIEFAEDVRKTHGSPPINYEIGSDRWIYKDIEHTRKLIELVMQGIREHGLNNTRILFIVGDVGTKVKPGNKIDKNKAKELIQIASYYSLFLKTHSTDYIEEPEEFPRLGIGGANIGPMFADLKYKIIKKLVLIEDKLTKIYSNLSSSNIMRKLYEEVLKDGRWRKYVQTVEELKEKEYLFGLCTRYVWCNPNINNALQKLFKNLEKGDVNGYEILINELKEQIKYYMRSFNLTNLIPKIFK